MNIVEKFDVIIIGGGPGGTPAAIRLATSGKKVMLAEESGKLGGACLFVGCIPSKIIKHGADAFNLQRGEKTEITEHELSFLWQSIRRNMDRILNGRSNAAMQQISQMPIKFLADKARFLSNKEVEIGNNRYTFDNAIIATGAHSFVPPFKGNGVNKVLTSEELFKLPSMPASMLIVGGGPIGIELAQMLSKLRVKCTIVEMMPEVLSGLVEPEFAAGITKKMQDSGISIFTQAKVEEINKKDSRFQTVFVDAARKTQTLQTEKVLIVTGKVPTIEGLDLEAAGIKHDRHGIIVNEFLETSANGIYATGDVVSGAPKFAHTATYEAHLAAANIEQGNTGKVNFTKNSWVLFSDPEIAAAGLTEEEALKSGLDVISGVYHYNVDAAAQISGDTSGVLKFVVNRQNKQILGVHLFLNGAASLSGEASLIVSQKLTLMDLARAIHPHPTLSEAFGFLALKMLSDPRLKKTTN
jgi:dihydrolipoamide dehydrogenase